MKLGQVRPGRSRQAEIMLLGTGRELAMPGHLPSPKAWHQATLGETQRVAQDCRWTRAPENPDETSHLSPAPPCDPQHEFWLSLFAKSSQTLVRPGTFTPPLQESVIA